MTEAIETRSVAVTRVFDAPIELVYSAWVRPELVVRWMKCDVEATYQVENWDPAPGHRFRTHMVQEGVFDVRGSGRFDEVEPPTLLAYTFDADPDLGTPEMRLRVEFAERDGGTEVRVTQSGVPFELCPVIEGGWTSSLGALADIAAELVPGGAA